MAEEMTIFEDITNRTGGNIYISAVGPVRTGKSTFIKKFMDLIVLPRISDEYDRARTTDALPQSGAGKTIMTTELKFVPDEAIAIEVKEGITAKIRLVDCVGYAVEGALGFKEANGPRMVRTPWYDHPIAFEEAAEIGTRKVITDYSTMGILVTTDGSITDLPREAYVPAEERAVSELQELNKPFIVVLNSTHPHDDETVALAGELEEKYQTPLFDRMNRQIYPTKKAHLLYNHSLLILSSLENMENEMYEDHVENISFGCSVTMAQVFLPQLLKKLKMIYPTIHFHIIVNNLEYIENLLLKNELDFALIETTPLHQLKKIAFYQDELVIIVHPKHPLLKVKDLKELEHYDYYSREKGSSIYELVHSYFISHDLDIVPTIECTNPHALIELVKQNDGFSILPYSLVKESKEITYLKNNDFQIQRTYHIVMHKDKKLLPLYQEIFELIKKE